MKLTDLITKKECLSPSGINMNMWTGISGEEFDKIQAENGDFNKYGNAAKILISWDLEDDNGEILPITAENMKKIPIEDLTFILRHGKDLNADKPKDEPKK